MQGETLFLLEFLEPIKRNFPTGEKGILTLSKSVKF